MRSILNKLLSKLPGRCDRPVIERRDCLRGRSCTNNLNRKLEGKGTIKTELRCLWTPTRNTTRLAPYSPEASSAPRRCLTVASRAVGVLDQIPADCRPWGESPSLGAWLSSTVDQCSRRGRSRQVTTRLGAKPCFLSNFTMSFCPKCLWHNANREHYLS